MLFPVGNVVAKLTKRGLRYIKIASLNLFQFASQPSQDAAQVLDLCVVFHDDNMPYLPAGRHGRRVVGMPIIGSEPGRKTLKDVEHHSASADQERLATATIVKLRRQTATASVKPHRKKVSNFGET